MILSVSCQNSGKPDKSEDKSTNKTVSNSLKRPLKLPPVPNNRLKRIYDEATQLDYIFFELPISMNMDNTEAIRSSLIHFDTEGVTLTKDCMENQGTLLYDKNGEILEEVNFYFSKNCKFFVWLENGKPTYGNMMNQDAVDFFMRLYNGEMIQRAQIKARDEGTLELPEKKGE
jgi:hypothetical protein